MRFPRLTRNAVVANRIHLLDNVIVGYILVYRSVYNQNSSPHS